MELKNKKIGFAMCGSFCTLSLIQFNFYKFYGRVGCIIKLYGCKMGASFDFVGANKTSGTELISVPEVMFICCQSLFYKTEND
ncbi:MAG: hypothetical protein ACI4EA_02375 [Candidatus Ornithomonoglobus sp.]